MGQENVKDERAALRSETPATERADQSDSTPPVPSELEALRQDLLEKDQEARANYDLFLRERAELENFKKRMQRDKAEALRYAAEPLIRELLPVIDNLERAIEHAGGASESVVDGVRLVLKSLVDILNRHGVKRIEAVGEPFDPNLHQALAQVESLAHAPNQVVEQHQSGYALHDRLLRPALVTVSGRKTNGPVETDPQSD